MRVLITTAQIPFVQGGAEAHAISLRQALRTAGAQAEIVAIPFKWYPPERILDQMLACRLLDITEVQGQKIDRVIALRFPAYYIPHERKTLWILHQHRPAYDQWNADDNDLRLHPNGKAVRDAIIHADKRLLRNTTHVYANSANVAQRIKDYCAADALPLYHPPPNAELLCNRGDDGYFYFPSRINRMKRQELVVRALAMSDPRIRVVVSGNPSHPAILDELRRLAIKLKVDQNISWIGHVSEHEKIALYGNCTAVLYPPIDEDYGYVTLEAMLSKKAVITCSDSGGVLEFINANRNGLISDPNPEQFGEAMQTLWRDRALACSLGANGYEDYIAKGISWAKVSRILLDAP